MLNLPPEVLKQVEEKKITAGHAKILVGLDNASFISNKIIEKKLSNDKFVNNAPENVIQNEMKKLEDVVEKIRLIKETLKNHTN